jgi:phage major head subunit gpT-like protein
MNPITQEELDALRVGFSDKFQNVLSATQAFWPQLCTEVPSSGYSNVYGWAVSALKLRQWIGPRMTHNMREHTVTVENVPYEGTIELDLRKMEIDRATIGIFQQLPLATLAAAAAKHPDYLWRTLVQSNAGAGPVGFDGVALFDSSHPNYNETGSGATTYDNTYALAFDAANFNTVWSAMVSFIGEDGEPMGVMPTHGFFAPQLKRTVTEVLSSNTYAQSSGGGVANAIDNPMKGWIEPVFLPELANDPTAWYLADLSKPIKPFIFQKRTNPVMTALDQLTNEKVFNEKVAVYGVDYEGAVAPTLPFLIAKSKP